MMCCCIVSVCVYVVFSKSCRCWQIYDDGKQKRALMRIYVLKINFVNQHSNRGAYIALEQRKYRFLWKGVAY